jgi:DNA-binding response OmpR family regulator
MKVLIAVHELRPAWAIKRRIEEDGHEARIGPDGAQAFEASTQDRFEAIVIDESLPDTTGGALCVRMRRAGVQAPILLLRRSDSTNGNGHDPADVGADESVTVPFSMGDLVGRIYALTDRYRGPAQEHRAQVGDLVLDVPSHSAIRGDQKILLTVREFQLLDLFMRNAGRALSRDRIRQEVWQYDRSSRNQHRRHLRALPREKIDRGTILR